MEPEIQPVPEVQSYPNLKIYKGGIDVSKGLIGDAHPWTFYYKAIRSANTFLNNVDRSPLEDSEKIALKNQVRFYVHCIIMNYFAFMEH